MLQAILSSEIKRIKCKRIPKSSNSSIFFLIVDSEFKFWLVATLRFVLCVCVCISCKLPPPTFARSLSIHLFFSVCNYKHTHSFLTFPYRLFLLILTFTFIHFIYLCHIFSIIIQFILQLFFFLQEIKFSNNNLNKKKKKDKKRTEKCRIEKDSIEIDCLRELGSWYMCFFFFFCCCCFANDCNELYGYMRSC